MYDYIDIHSHLNFSAFDVDREEIIAELKKNNMATITIGTHLETSREAVMLADSHENIYASIGLHPVDKRGEVFDTKVYEVLAKNPKVVAIGECGLDYALLTGTPDAVLVEKKRQENEFEKQIEFAVQSGLPMMFHCRDATPESLDILESKKREYGDKLRGNFHFFTSTIDVAKRCLNAGFSVSFTGPITFASQYEDLVRYVPLEKMMAETDAPYAAPAPHRGKRNSPLYVREIVLSIAEIKNEPLDKVRQQIVKNAFDLFLMKNSSLKV